ncbi:MAG: hypothetical protein KUG78_13435 [Kangiellaceae bacterium]|nr:hypothetical protein [Kangiellaceae bacterium]
MIVFLQKQLKSMLLLLTIFVLSSSLRAQQMAVVVNVNNTDEITAKMITQIYSDKRNFWATGHKILLFELPVKDKGREIFSEALLNKSAMASQADWSNRYVKNTIKNKVKIKPQKLVAKFVSIYPSAIGYIPLLVAEKQENIKIVMVINK